MLSLLALALTFLVFALAFTLAFLSLALALAFLAFFSALAFFAFADVPNKRDKMALWDLKLIDAWQMNQVFNGADGALSLFAGVARGGAEQKEQAYGEDGF